MNYVVLYKNQNYNKDQITITMGGPFMAFESNCHVEKEIQGPYFGTSYDTF